MPTSKFTVSNKPYAPRKGDFLCLPFGDGKTPYFPKSHAPRKLVGVKAPGKRGGSRTVHVGDISGQHMAAKVYRLDGEHSTVRQELKKMVASALHQAPKLGCKRVVVILDGSHADCCNAVQEGALLGGYAFGKYLTDKKKPLPVQLVAKTDSLPGLRRALADGATVAECVNFGRDVLNEPPNVIDPATLAEEFKRFGAESGLKVSVWDQKRLEKEECGGILAVGAGSSVKPRLVIGEYNPGGDVPHLCLVGKGVTFDTGGYCLKPKEGQQEMKLDMGGAAMMFPAACAVARLGLPIRVTVYTPLVRNDISSTAYHTTDVLTMRGGRTVQVNNTDAEGRLILADALTLACEQTPDFVIDSATLTGACVVALGEDIAGVFGTDREFNSRLISAGEDVGEFHWEMPLHMPYQSQLKVKIADSSNVGPVWGGSITAALFLEQFVKKGQTWIHVDIAGPGCKDKPLGHLGRGAKGFGVKTIARLAELISSSD